MIPASNSCTYSGYQNPSSEVYPHTYLALGDAYTIGVSVDPRLRWPEQLATELRTLGIPIGEPTIMARNGWTTGELLTAVHGAGIDEDFDLVSLLIGVHNQYQGQSLQRFEGELDDLLDVAVACTGGRADNVVVVSIPDWSVTPFAEGRDRVCIAREIDAFNSVVHKCARASDIFSIDITVCSRRAANEPQLVAPDGLHPSGHMYAYWVDAIRPFAFEALTRSAQAMALYA